jgi:NAD+ kinase
MPSSDNFVITPIAPHNLNVRPVIISSNDVVSLEIESRSPNFLASIDSYSEVISKELKIKIKKAKFSIALVKLPKHDFLSTLRNKLMWGVDKRN